MRRFRGIRRNQILIAVLLALWIPPVFWGAHIMLRYANTPGAPAKPPAEWPSNAPFQHSATVATLMLFIHPQCPCSTATLEELSRIITRTGGVADTRVFFFSPPGMARDWLKSSLWNSAIAIPHVKTIEDRNGLMARSFGAATSGQAILYDRRGRLVFTGGITLTRGHAGDNDGYAAVIGILNGSPNQKSTAPVFGCSLLGPQ